MINRGATFISRLAVIFAVLFMVIACGGGGGGSFYDPEDDDDNPSGSTLGMALFDATGNETNSITASSPGTVKVTVKSGGANILVSATTSLGTLTPSTGTALTDSSGVATFQLEAADAESGAGGTVTATATVNEVQVTGNLAFQVGDNGLRLGYFDEDGTFLENQISIQPAETLSAGGNGQLAVVILDKNGERVTTAQEVRFNSGCIAAGQSTINPANPVVSINAQAATSYTVAGCSGIDQITASLVGASAQATGSISIASAQANAVNFVSATPALIVLRGTGGANRDETSDVVFQVVDSTGSPLAGIPVALSLTTEIGGLSISPISGLSNGDGQVRTTVTAGDVATTVRVIASVAGGNGETIATTSDVLTVTTGLPDQNSISIAVEECDNGSGFMVKKGMVRDGIICKLTVSMADKFNNPVVDGTAAVFTTEFGAVVGTCTTVGGTCSVNWRTQEPRFPTITGTQYVQTNGGSPNPNSLGYTIGGRSTIMVRAQGEESFVDSNGNGVMDEAEQDLFVNLSEAFIDNNEDGAYTPELPSCQSSPLGTAQCRAGLEETFFDYNNNQVFDLNNEPAVYNGLLCPPEGNGVWCSRELVEVRDDIVLTLLDDEWYVRRSGNTLFFADIFNNPPPQGSTINLKENDGCKVLGETTRTVPNLYFTGAYAVTVETEATGGTVTVTLEGTDGIEPDPVTFDCNAAVEETDPCDVVPPAEPPEGCPVP